MKNIPDVKIGIVAVSRDCFPIELSRSRLAKVEEAVRSLELPAKACQTVIESEKDMLNALNELGEMGANALVVYLGNFGPEIPDTMLAQKFGGPVMYVAAAEESMHTMMDGRGDAFCGLLNASYSLKLRGIKAYLPEYPVGTPEEVAQMIEDFVPIARVQIGLKGLKVFSFGPRPYDFIACNAPIQPLFDLGIEIQENSELDLFASYNAHKGDKRIDDVVKDMQEELGDGNNMPGILPKLAQFEITLLDWMQDNLGACQYAVFANKCWPAFQTQFGFVPCYVNSRMAARGIPVSCEVDIYGAISEYMITLATLDVPTLLDINNTVPKDLYEEGIAGKFPYAHKETFMGFHCGNTAAKKLVEPKMSYQLIMKRSLEPDSEPDITRGTLEGTIAPGPITLFRFHSTADCKLVSYVAQGETLPVDPHSFGAIGVIGVKEMGRFYRHVLVGKNYPHHAGMAFAHAGKTLFAVAKLLGAEVDFNQPAGVLYKDENPFG